MNSALSNWLFAKKHNAWNTIRRIIFPNVEQLMCHAYYYRQWHGHFASKVINRVATIFPKVAQPFRSWTVALGVAPYVITRHRISRAVHRSTVQIVLAIRIEFRIHSLKWPGPVHRRIDKSQILREQIPGVMPRLSIITAKWLIVC